MASLDNFQEYAPSDIECDPKSYEAGSGANGDVIFGHHKILHKTVAIKVFEVAGGHQAKSLIVEKIKEEMKHLRKANHENIVHVYGYVEWSFSMGIVMEYCRGGNLQTFLLNNNIKLGIGPCLRMLLQTAKGVKACHDLPDKRLIHGDIKSGNILLTEHLQIKIGDFGGAEFATWSTLRTVNPLARSKKSPQYTLYYTAPEKLKDLRMKPTTALDIYAFAIVIYEVLAREVPYPPRDQKELLDLIKQGMRPDCSKIHDWIHTLDGYDKETVERLVQLMERCWKQEPSNRPASMTEVVDQLEKLLQRQDPTNVQQEVENARKELKLDVPQRFSEQGLSPLHQFSTRSRSFLQESNISEITREGSNQLIDTDSTDDVTTPSDIRQRRRNQPEPAKTETDAPEPEPQLQINIRGKCLILIELLLIALVVFLCLMTFTNWLVSSSYFEDPTWANWKIYDNENVDEDSEILGGAYRTSIQKGNYQNANYVEQKLVMFLDKSGSTADELYQIAKNLTESKDYILGILFFDMASDLYKKHPESTTAASGIVLCTEELLSIIKAVIGEGFNSYGSNGFSSSYEKRIVRDHVIPVMNGMKSKIQNLKNISLDHRHLQELVCLNSIGMAQKQIGDLPSSDKTLTKALDLMEEWFGNESSKHSIYITLLKSLQAVLQQTTEHERSGNCYVKLIEAEKQHDEWKLKTSAQN